MKKYHLYILVLAAAISSCRKDDNRIFTESADARLNKVIAEYQSQLTAATNGWKAVITPANQTPYNFYFRFMEANRVVMYADFDSNTARVGRESSYRLKALQQPSLLFDTYSHLHVLSDPDERVNNGQRGAGLSSDFEFAFDRVVGDTLKLTGRVNGTKLSLVKATAEERADWENKNWERAITSVSNLGRILNYFKRLTVNGVEYEIIVDQFNRMVYIRWIDAGGVTRTFSSEYKYSPTPAGITFNTPLNTGNGTIAGLYGITFDAATTKVNGNVGNNVPASITGAIKPLITDLTAPSRWWNQSVNLDNYWISFSGFTSNGVGDATNLRGIPGFQYLLFWAQYGTGTDLLGYVANNSLGYGNAFNNPTFTADGRIIFPYRQNLGTVPAGVAAIVLNTKNMMAEPTGYYFVQTGPNTYDMVSANDAKTWITWEW
jgi:hypothetical protein